jgi:hypothetical protein
MRAEDLDQRTLVQLEAALRRGESCSLQLRGSLPRHLRAEQVVPWFNRVQARESGLTAALEHHLPPVGGPRSELRVTAVIPTNRGTPLGLRALREQDVDIDVLVLVNGDALAQGDQVLRLPWTGHGPVRQAGVREATGEYILFTVDDALPRGKGCVRAMVDALEDGGYDAVFGRQVPWPTSDVVSAERLQDWTPPGQGHWPVDRLDHVFALFRRQTLLDHPLPAVPIGEDLHWRQGRRVGYVPGATVLHAHVRRPGELYRRTRDLHIQHHLVGDEPTVPTLAALTAALPGVLRPVLRGGPGELANQLAELFGQYRAARLTRG